jgi:hypothetical protein
MPKSEITPSIKFACAVATTVHNKGTGKRLANELWPAAVEDMSAPMREFLLPSGSFWLGLTPEERAYLIRAEGNWPEYPVKIQELAHKYGVQPPWQTLPSGNEAPPADLWDKYRVKPQQKADAAVGLPNREVALFSNHREGHRPADLPIALPPLDAAIERVALHRHPAGFLDQPPQLGHG